MNTSSRKLEKSSLENEVTINVNVSSYSNSHVGKIPSVVWRSVKTQVASLLDANISQEEKERIGATLTGLFERLECEHVLELNIPSSVPSIVRMNSGSVVNLKVQNVDPNERLKSKIAEFNVGLVHLGNKISTLKNKLLSWDYGSTTSELTEIEVCRSVQRNFRRILQKESRFLRDELIAARAKIRWLEKQLFDNSNRKNIVPNRNFISYAECNYSPLDFINIESTSLQLSVMPPTAFHSTSAKRFQHNPNLKRRPLLDIELPAANSESNFKEHSIFTDTKDLCLTPIEILTISSDFTEATKSVSPCSIYTVSNGDSDTYGSKCKCAS